MFTTRCNYTSFLPIDAKCKATYSFQIYIILYCILHIFGLLFKLFKIGLNTFATFEWASMEKDAILVDADWIMLSNQCLCVQMRDDLEKLEDRLEWANNALKSDWTRWNKVMRTDLRSAFVDTAERNVSYYEKVSCLFCFYCCVKEV